MKTYLPLLIVCLTIIGSVFFLTRTRFVIKNDNRPDSDTISVTGDGKVYAKPDMVTFSISFEETASTSRSALNQVNQRINQAMQILDDHQIPKNDISTSSLNIYTDYDYTGGTRRIRGQRASQSLNIKVKKIDDKAAKAAQLIDDLSELTNIHINSINFDLEDKSKFYSQARELAFEKAKQKASELAKMGGLKLLKPVSISDASYDFTPRVANYAAKSMSLESAVSNDTSISSGELALSIQLNVLWGVE